MKIKFNLYERVAGLFVLTAIVGSLAAAVAVAISRGWFESKVALEARFETADGIRPGTLVQMAGLRAGQVDTVELLSNNEVLVRFKVSKKFHEKIRKDSVVRPIRPFVIGEKILEVTVGSEAEEMVRPGGILLSENTMDLMDLMSGRKLGTYISAAGRYAEATREMLENLKYVAEALLDPKRSKAFVKMFDEMMPLVRNLNSMSKDLVGVSKDARVLLSDINGDKQLKQIVSNMAALSNELNKALPALAKEAPELSKDLTKIAKNVAILTDEFQKLVPLIAEVTPALPGASRRAIEALDETVVTLKALQKSFILRGNVQEVRDEEARKPAGEPK